MRDRHLIEVHDGQGRIPSDTEEKPDPRPSALLPDDFCEDDPSRPFLGTYGDVSVLNASG
jgi:hypothetical protein